MRKPRVHIVTDVETGNAIEMPELPFVVGVLGEFSGQPAEPLPPVKDRRFVDVTADNYDEVLKSMKPRLSLRVENRLEENRPDPGELSAELHFESIEDFEPHKIAEKVPYLKELVEMRARLNDLKGNMDGRVKFEELLEQAVRDSNACNRLADEIKQFREGQKK